MKLDIKRRKLLGTLLASGLVQGCGGGAGGAGNSGAGSGSTGGGGSGGTGGSPVTPPPVIQPDIEAGPVGPTLSALAGQPLYIAHRGSAALYPEETYLAYDESVRNGQTLLEGDVQSLRDGSLALMHDSTVDRTTSAAGAVASMTEADWKALRVDASTWHGTGYGDDLPVPLFAEWVQKYRDKAIFVPEDKDGRSTEAMLAIFDALKVSREQVLMQSFSMTSVKIAVKAGYQACYLYTGSPIPADVVAAGVGWVGLPVTVSSADLKKWTDSGLKILLWTVSRRFQRDGALAAGVRGFFSDDPVYLRETRPLATSDEFSKRTWLPGMLGNGSDTSLALRGEFFKDGYWGYSTTKLGYMGCLHGYLCPIRSSSDPRVWTAELKITFDAALDGDATRWASVFLGVDDKPYLDAAESSAGYHLIFHKNGVIEIGKKSLNAKTVVQATGTGTAISDGEEISYRISCTEDTLSVERLGSTQHSVQVRDTSFHVVYLHLGRNGLACRFRQISVK